MIKNTYQFTLLAISVLVVSACTQMQAPTTQSISIRDDSGVVTPLPPKLNNAPMTSMNQPLTGYGTVMPMQDGGMIMPNDNSVTIFPVDGAMAAGIPQYGQASGQSFGMSQNAGSSYGLGGNMQASNNRIFFKDGSSRLGSLDRQRIENAAQSAQFGSMVSVEGYASRPTQAGSGSVESHILNLKQSMNRSYAVARQLMREGVPGEKVKAVSWGSARATGDNNFDRRVDINTGAAF